jgi:hypothetical protein
MPDLYVVLTYLGFPLLEAILRNYCSRYIAYSECVLEYFEVPIPGGKARQYKVGDRCSMINHLLFLLYKEVVSEDLRDVVDISKGSPSGPLARARPFRYDRRLAELVPSWGVWVPYDWGYRSEHSFISDPKPSEGPL